MVNVSSRQFEREAVDGTEVWIQDNFSAPLTVNYTGGTDQPLMESLEVSDNDSFLDCSTSLPNGVRLDHVNNPDGLVSWNFSLEPGADSGVYVVPIDFLFHHPQGPGSNDYQGTLNLNIHYVDTAEAPSYNNAKASETLSLFNGTFHLYTTDQNPVAGCTLNLPEGFSITPGSTSVVGPGRYDWTAKILPSMASGDYSVPISAHWKSRDLSDTGHFEFSIPINYTAPVVPSGEIIYQITEAGKDYYLVGFNRDKLSPVADSASLQAVAAMSETDILSEDIALESLGVKASTATTSSSVSFALVTTAGSNRGKVFQYTEGASTPWKDAKTTLTIPTAAKSMIASAAATPPSAYVFPTDYTIKKLNLDAFREQILEKVIIALDNIGVAIPEDELVNIKAGIFYGVDRYGFGDLIIKSNAVDMKVNESSVYYLYARHMTGLAICAWMSSINYKGMDNAFNQLKTVGFLPKCGYMTPEATLGLKNSREYTATEFNQMGKFGQGLELNYLGVKQLATNLVKLQKDYTGLKKLNKNWVMILQDGTWSKVTQPMDSNFPNKNLVDLYISGNKIDGKNRIIVCKKDELRGMEYLYSDGVWSNEHFAQAPIETSAASTAAATSTADSRMSASALPVATLIVQVATESLHQLVLSKLKLDFSIDYKTLTKAQKASIDRAWKDSVDQNLYFGLMQYYNWKLLPPDDDDYYYWQTKALCDLIFSIQLAYATAVTVDATIAMLAADGVTGSATLGSGGTLAPAFVGSVTATGVCAATAGLSSLAYANSLDNVKYSSNKLQSLLDAFNAQRLEIAAQVETMMQPAIRIIKQKYPTAKVGYRGSLATNKRAEGKGPFDPSDFDVDAFIVSDELAKLIKPSSNGFRDARVNSALGVKSACNDIEELLKSTFPGYRVDLKKPFTFRVWTEAEYIKTVVPSGFKLIE